MVKTHAPDMIVLGPGGVGEGTALAPPGMHLVSSESILQATGHAAGPGIHAPSYHILWR